MNLLFATNEAFIPGFKTALNSLCLNNPEAHEVYVANDGISASKQASLEQFFKPKKCNLHFVNIGKGFFNQEPFLSLPRYNSLSMSRLAPGLVVPKGLGRLLYVDCDMIVRGSLSEFYNLDFNGKALAAICLNRNRQDGGPYDDPESDVYSWIKYPFDPRCRYFNAGILLLNMSVFDDVTPSTYEPFVETNKNQLLLADQDILNFFFMGKVLEVVDRRLNCAIPENMRFRKGEYRWIKDNVIVLHFVVAKKPWMPWKYRNRLFHLYMAYFKKEGHPCSYIGRYLVWYFMKPWHFLAHCWRKGLSLLKGKN